MWFIEKTNTIRLIITSGCRTVQNKPMAMLHCHQIMHISPSRKYIPCNFQIEYRFQLYSVKKKTIAPNYWKHNIRLSFLSMWTQNSWVHFKIGIKFISFSTISKMVSSSNHGVVYSFPRISTIIEERNSIKFCHLLDVNFHQGCPCEYIWLDRLHWLKRFQYFLNTTVSIYPAFDHISCVSLMSLII